MIVLNNGAQTVETPAGMRAYVQVAPAVISKTEFRKVSRALHVQEQQEEIDNKKVGSEAASATLLPYILL